MPTYLSLINFTDQGIKNIKDSPKRLDATKKALQKLGGELKSFHLTQGSFDGVLIFDLPNEQALTSFLLTTGAAGNVRTTTVRAFTEEEYRKHIKALP
jgi:uncharacterized protein with GYD domain